MNELELLAEFPHALAAHNRALKIKQSGMISQAGWKWYGYAGHYITGYRCAFHLTTLIDGKYLVSTVGNLDAKMKEVGVGRAFETMVFKCDGEKDGGDPNIIDLSEIDFAGYNDSLLAEKGHYKMCYKWAQRPEAS